jgi:dTDP-4-dehydrorhamnose 3,5-epimerase-like enzyme
MTGDTYCDGRVCPVAMGVFEDTRGALAEVELTSCDFHPVRAFVVTAPTGAVRGGHGHKKGRQLLICVSGEIEVELFYQGRTQHLKLDATHRAVLIEPPVWSRQVYLGDNPIMLVFCDTLYDPEDYIWSKDETELSLE